MFRFIPREEKYFTLLSQLASRVREGGELFVQIFQDYAKHAEYAEKIKMIEVDCDDLGAKIKQKLNSSFITPIDREDIYLLTSELDDVIDLINDLARGMDIYSVTSPRPDAVQMANLLSRATAELEAAFTSLERHQNIQENIRAVSEIEKHGDTLYSDAIRWLFAEEKDPIQVIKWMSIYEKLEDSIDRCKDVAEELEAVVVKNK